MNVEVQQWTNKNGYYKKGCLAYQWCSEQISPHIICTAAKYNKTTGYHVPLSNFENIENDECIPDGGAMVYEYIGRTINEALVDYFAKIIAIYPS